MLMRRSVARKRWRPDPDRKEKGRQKHITRTRRYRFGRISQLRTDAALPLVMVQNRRSEKARGMVRMMARR
jgi:hypothetical protein